MAIDHRRIDAFLDRRSTRQQAAQVVRGAGFKITWVVDNPDERLWGLFLKPNSTLQQLFGTSREVLLWAAEFRDFQARTVQQAQEIIRDEHPRLSDDYCLILVPGSSAPERVSEVASKLLSEYVGVPLEDLHLFQPLGTKSFIAYLQGRLFSRDLYRVSTPVTDPRGFYGRRALIGEVTALLSNGVSNVGVFGLRKMGKTSLLYRILESLRSSGRTFPCHVDLQRMDALNPTVEYALWSLGEALLDSNSRLRKFNDLRLFGKHSLFSETTPADVPELFDHDVRVILSKTNRLIVFLLDEIELMAPIIPGSRWENAFVTFWRLLRGLSQQFPGKISYLITGTNPKCIEVNRLNEIENPAYNYFDVKYLPALDLGEAQQLLSEIGIRMGLDWSDSATQTCFRLTGGHPFLLRGMASVVHRSLGRRTERVRVTEESVTRTIRRFLLEFNPNLSQMVEVLRDYYPDEFFLLERLATGRVGEFRELAQAFPEDVAHLHGYGLIASEVQEARMVVEVLQTWLQRRIRTAQEHEDDHGERPLEPGASIAGYEVISAIGHKGGFAQVYKAREREGQASGEVAIKLFRGGLLGSLQREMDTLQGISHPNIVRFIEHGRTDEGWLYLVMEYLPGPSLKMRVDRASRLGNTETTEVLSGLASALVRLHPNEEKVESMRRKEELDPSDLEELEIARHGFVHRDIKPENILLVEGRGPVLIDFNISSEVGAPVRTLKHTPGYVPPEGFPAQWNPSIDLYALGVTMLQASVGIDFTGDNLEDIREVARAELGGLLFDTVSRLCSTQPDARFGSARELLDAVRRCDRH